MPFSVITIVLPITTDISIAKKIDRDQALDCYNSTLTVFLIAEARL